MLWGIVVGLLQAATPLVWLHRATVYALGRAVIAGIDVGFAVADGRPKGIAVESDVTFAFLVVATAAVTGSPWLLVVDLARARLKDLGQHRTRFVANTRCWPPFCMIVDWVVAATIVAGIAAGMPFGEPRRRDSIVNRMCATRSSRIPTGYLFPRAQRRLARKKQEYPRLEHPWSARMAIIHRSEGMAKFLDYQRSRGRIARATWFNLIVTAAAITVLFVGQGVPSVGLVVFIAIAVIAGIILAALSAFEIEVAWNARLHDASAVLAREDAQGQNGAIGTRAPS